MTSPTFSLLGRVAAGDDSAVDECLSRYGGLVWSIVRRFSSNRADAEDAVQEIFIEIWRSAERFDASIASEPTFVAMIARRRLIDRQRRHDRQPTTTSWDDRDVGAATRDPIDWLQVCDDAALVRTKMQQLSAEQLRVLTLAIEGDCSQTEIARRLDLPLGTVKTHARRGLIRLRELLSPGSDDHSTEGGAP